MAAVTLIRSQAPVPYPDAVAVMENRVAAIRSGATAELLWLLEHPPLYTAGTSARPEDLLDPKGLPVFASGRGGQYTYHGPGQRVAYLMLDLKRRRSDLKRYVHDLEAWVIAALARLGVEGERRPDRIGVWVRVGEATLSGESKIAAVGVRVRHWVTFHGVAVNLDPTLDMFAGILPCGLDPSRYGVTSLAALGRRVAMAELDAALTGAFPDIFGVSLVEAAAGGPVPGGF